MILQIRTKDNLEELLKQGNSPAWVIAESRVPEIQSVEIYQFDGKRVLKADFDAANSTRTESDRLVVAFKNGVIEDSDMDWNGQNPVRYQSESSLNTSTDTTIITSMENLKNNEKISEPVKNEVVITIGGEIPKYFFGKLKENIKGELQKLIQFMNGDIQSMSNLLFDFISAVFKNYSEDFKNRFSELDFINQCPQLSQILQESENDWGLPDWRINELLFDMPEEWIRGEISGNHFLPFFEENARITVTVDGSKIIDNINLSEFEKSIFGYNLADEAQTEEQKALAKWLTSFCEVNSEIFGLPDEEIGVSINSHGTKFMCLWFTPPSLSEFLTRDNAVVIEKNDTLDYKFILSVENFKFDKLAFLSHANTQDFRESEYSNVANFLFYDNRLIVPEGEWYDEQIISVNFEPDNFKRLDFFLEG